MIDLLAGFEAMFLFHVGVKPDLPVFFSDSFCFN
jgi:hypothetical protein